MPDNEKFKLELDYNRAIKLIQREDHNGRNSVPGILNFLFDKKKIEVSKDLLDNMFFECLERKYIVKQLKKMHVPKPNFTVRPTARPVYLEWVLYEAIVDTLSNIILKDSDVCDSSFSNYYFKNKDDVSVRLTTGWVLFKQKIEGLIDKGEHKSVLVTDITGFYENIVINVLKDKLTTRLPEDYHSYVDVLVFLLKGWNQGKVSGLGLPQGPVASSFLADLYLDEIDRKIKGHGEYFRYMDDIVLFCDSEITSRKVLMEITDELSRVKLNVNSAKTKIYCNHEELKKDLVNPKADQLNYLKECYDAKSCTTLQEEVLPGLIELSLESFAKNDKFTKTNLNFTLYRITVLHHSLFTYESKEIFQNIKENFANSPSQSQLFCEFLSIYRTDEESRSFLIEFLQSEKNIYEWQELQVLKCLIEYSAPFNENFLNFCLEEAFKESKHFTVRAFYLLVVGKFGGNAYRNRIKDMYIAYGNRLEKYIIFAMILSVQELLKDIRNNFYGHILRREDIEEIGEFIEFVKSFVGPKYFLSKEYDYLECDESYGYPW